ncbi:MAG: ABC transporter permease [Candidatus Acidiferrales bacterium]
MRRLRAWFVRFGAMFGKQRRDRELAAELESHLQLHIEENLRAGMTPEEARRQALIKLGGVEQTKESYRDRRGLPWLESLLQDIRFGIRMLRKNPGFTAVAVLTLALGIGVNVAIFSVIDATLLDPIPLPQPDRIASVFVTWPSFAHAGFSYPNFLDTQRESRSFSGLAAWRFDSFSLTGPGEPQQLRGKMVSGNFFSVLGIQPILGRGFLPSDDRIGSAPVAILSEGLWKRRFAAQRDIVGRSLDLDGKAYTIVGVAPARLHLIRFEDSLYDDVFVPLGQWDNPLFFDRRFSIGLRAVGRLSPGVTLAQAQAELAQIGHQLVAAFPDKNPRMGLGAASLKEDLVGEIRPALLLLWGAVGLVLLIACANVANLLLARSSAREQEFAVRVAMGASRGRLVRQLLVESVLLASAGGALGVALAAWGTPLVLNVFPSVLPAVARVQTNFTVLAVALGVSFATGIAFGLAPAFRISAAHPGVTLKEGGRGAETRRHRVQGTLVAVEVGLSLMLLIGAGLLIRSFANVWAVNPGFNPNKALTFGVALSPENRTNPEKALATLHELTEKIDALPGVQSDDMVLGDMPLEGDEEAPVWPAAKPKPSKSSEWPLTIIYTVGPDYFRAMGIPVIQGRVFTAQDGASAPHVAVIDQELAKSAFAGEDPLGKTVVVGADPAPIEIVGVVGHVKHWGLDADAKGPVRNQIYFSYEQSAGPLLPIALRDTNVIVRAAASTTALVGPIRSAITSVDAGAVVYNVRSMEQFLDSSLAERRFSMIMLGIFAGIALLLATVGVYGVISYLVGLRTHEIGIRMALGAQRLDILRIVLGEGGKMALAGIVLGLAASLGLTRFMAAMLFGVTAADPATFVGVALLLVGVTLAACWIPARRAMRVDPMVALRHE